MNRKDQLIQRIADVIGFDMDTQAWVAEPLQLYEIHPELPVILAEFFGSEEAA